MASGLTEPTTDEGPVGDGFADALVRELPRLVRLATRLVRDPDQAEDCAQETIVGAWRRQDQLRDPAALSAWLRRSLVNRIIDRSRVHHDELDIDAVESDWHDDHYSVAPERVLERAELHDELEDALARLPVIYRVTVILHDVFGWTAAEIAHAMDAGLPATKQRLRRARMMLVSALAEDDERRQASLAQPLRCWRARRHVSAYLDDELDADTRSAVEAHLEACPTCPRLYAGLVGVKASLGGLRDPDTVVEIAIAGRIREHVAEAAEPRRSRARMWDARHASHDPIESRDADPTLVDEVRDLAPGTALDLGAGDGRNAIWLAQRGWRVTAVDFSTVALDRGRALARAAGVYVDFRLVDLLDWTPAAGVFDLVTLLFIHLPPDERRPVYARAAAAVAPGGTFLVVGHDRSNLTAGVGGPRDADVLFTPDEITAELPIGFSADRAEVVRRASTDDPAPLDAIVRAVRRR